MKESRISTTSSDHKRPTWNSKTKITSASPIKGESPSQNDKVKTKPPIPKNHKSPIHKTSEIRSNSNEKKIIGGTKICSVESHEENKGSNEQKEKKSTENENSNGKKQNDGEKEIKTSIKSYKFEELIKHNTEIISSMKQPIESTP